MKILIVTQYYWPENFRINDLSIGLQENNHEITVLTSKPNYPIGQYFPGYGFFTRNFEIHDGIKVYRVPQTPRGNGGSLLLMLNYISFTFFSTLLAAFYCQGKFDIIFVYEPSPIFVGIPARFLSWIKKAPLIFWVQDLWPESLTATGTVSNKYILSVVGRIVKWIYKGCDLILVQSRSFTDAIRCFKVPVSRIKYFPNTAEALYRPLSHEQSRCGSESIPDGFVVMFAGNIGVAQDFDTILAAAMFTKHKANIHWVILGEGRQFNWVKDEVERLRMAEVFHMKGSYPMEDMPVFFARADVMLVSLKREPIFAMTIPGKIQSYLACAKPIIAALDGEGGQVIEESGSGFAVEAENPRALANAVLAMEEMDINKRRIMGAKGLKYYNDNFERNMLLEKLEVMLQTLIKASD